MAETVTLTDNGYPRLVVPANVNEQKLSRRSGNGSWLFVWSYCTFLRSSVIIKEKEEAQTDIETRYYKLL